MRTLTHLIFSLLLIMAQPVIAQEQANDIDWKVGEWGDLSPYIGTYDYDAVLRDERVEAALAQRLNEEQRNALWDKMQVRNPIGFEDDCLLLSANAVSSADTSSAFVAVCLYKATVHVGMQHGTKITLYTDAKKYEYLPHAMRLWVYSQYNPGAASKMPDGVELQFTP